MKIDTLKKFVKTHKTKIIIGSTAVAATAAVGMYLGKNIKIVEIVKGDNIVSLMDSSGDFMFTATQEGLQKVVDAGGEFRPDFGLEEITVILTDVK